MKNSILILFFCVSLSTFAQTESNLEILLDRLQENHMGSVSDVFTLEEQQILKAHFASLSINSETSISGGGIYLFGPNNSKGTFGKFDVMDPTVINPISNSPLNEFEGAGAFDYANQEFKIIDNVGSMYKISLQGAYEYERDITPPAGESFTGIEYNTMTGTLYGLSTDGAGSSTLSSIDPVAGTTTPIGNTEITLPINLAIDNTGVAYSIGLDGNWTFRINLETAETTPVGPSGFDPNFGQGMAYDFNNNKIYLSAFNNDSFKSELRSLDTTTGMTTYLGDIGSSMPGGTIQIGWVGSPDNQLSVIDFGNFGFTFYPNPVKERLTIKANNNIETITIFNLLGQKVISQKIEALSSTINISKLASGNYILRVAINNQIEAYKLIKQ